MKKEEKAFERILKRVSPETKKFIDKNLAITDQIRTILSRHPKIKTQKQLAQALGKKESEISKWMTGMHNLTLESITKIEVVLGEDIIVTSSEAVNSWDNFIQYGFACTEKTVTASMEDTQSPYGHSYANKAFTVNR